MPLGGAVGVLRERHGRDVSGYDEAFLAKAVEKRRRHGTYKTAGAYLERLADDAVEAEALCRSLRVVYSEFFRDPLAFALLEQIILPALVAAKKTSVQGEIRVWSAACAAGQEPWSVAILLDELLGAQPPDTLAPYRIFATDLSETDLAVARAGVYSATALGNVRRRHLDSLFSPQGGGLLAIVPRIRAQVEFSLYDLLDESTSSPSTSIYGDFDLVLCCNVLLYYRPEAQRFILDKLRRCLAPGGYLVTGESERQMVETAGGFRAVAPPASVFQMTRR